MAFSFLRSTLVLGSSFLAAGLAWVPVAGVVVEAAGVVVDSGALTYSGWAAWEPQTRLTLPTAKVAFY